MPALSATARIQFNRDFRFVDAIPVVPYLARLGISHMYASPILAATPGSSHGYDVVDPTRVNPELGGEQDLQRLVEALRAEQMGLIIDIVPNHMAVSGHNPWWQSVLEWGPESPYARYFDIRWQDPDPNLNRRVLLPFLRSDYAEVLRAGEIELSFDAANGRFYAHHFDHCWPLAPTTYNMLLALTGERELCVLGQRFNTLSSAARPLEQAAKLHHELALLGRVDHLRTGIDRALQAYSVAGQGDATALHALLQGQHYRLSSWRIANDMLNWRRFFDINELAGLRVEDPDVFAASHGKILELVERGWIDGLRIDHIDGLARPRAYCRKLRRAINRIQGLPAKAMDDHRFPIFAEKILGPDEQLASDWGLTGTTGYEFLNQVSLLQHEGSGEPELTSCWRQISGRPGDFRREAYEARRQVLSHSLGSELTSLVEDLTTLAQGQLDSRDISAAALRRGLVELIAHYPVYRSYAGPAGPGAQDRDYLSRAFDAAQRTLAPIDAPALRYLNRWLGTEALHSMAPGHPRQYLQRLRQRFQQLTGPVAAKAIEDTACYRAGALLSRYEVGCNSEQLSAPVSQFHHACQYRARLFPANLLSTATHDTKRGEDSRARLAVLSENASWFCDQLRHWRSLAHPLKARFSPSPGEEAQLYQCLLGSWPLDLDASDQASMADYLARLLGWQQKALREAKLNSAWSAPDKAYERASAAFLRDVISAPEALPLRQSLQTAVDAIAPAGALNGLAQTLLRMTTPGVPDLYQGTEYWDFNLVDPDNRRPVNFAARQRSLQHPETPAELLANWRNGRIKQWLIQRALRDRQTTWPLLSKGRYLPLRLEGAQAHQLLAFARHYRGDYRIVVVPIHASALLTAEDGPHVPPDRWRNTRLILPTEIDVSALQSVLDDRRFACRQSSVQIAELLSDLPLNLLRPLTGSGNHFPSSSPGR